MPIGKIKFNGVACVVGLTAVLVNMLTLPLRGLVPPTHDLLDTPLELLVIDYVVDALMLLLFLVQLVCRPTHVRRLWLEGLAFVPLDLAAYALGYRGNFGWWRLNHILSVVALLRYLRLTEAHFWRMSVQKRRTMYILTILPMCSHWFACLWFYVAYVERADMYAWNKQALYAQFYNHSTGVAYLRSIYWAATMLTTVGFGDVTAVTRLETLLSIVVIYLGVFLSCASIACVLKLMEHADRNQMALQERLDDVCGYLEWRGASDDLIDRALATVRASFVPQIETTRAELETQLPHALRTRLQIEREEVLVHTVPQFTHASKSLRAAISAAAVYVTKAAGDVLLTQGQPLEGLFLLRRGEAHCVVGHGMVKPFNERDFVGDDALWGSDHVAPFTLVCVSACEFVFLARAPFQDMWQVEVDQHPAAARAATDGADDHETILGHESTSNSSRAASQYRRRGCRVHSTDWLPNSMFRRLWTLACFGGLLYNIYAVPRDCAFFRTHNRFAHPDTEATVDLVLFWTFDALFFVDFFLHCRRFYAEYDGHLVSDRAKIFRRYAKSVWFWIDLVSILPLDLGAAWTSMESLPFLRLNKIVRIFHLTEYFEVAEALLLARFHVHVFARRILRIISILILSGYLVGCFWYYVGEVTAQVYGETNNWVYVDQHNPHFYFSTYVHNRFYLIRSMYFGYIGGSTLGFGDIVPVNPYETCIATVMLLYGAILKPALVGGVASLLLTRNKTQVSHQRTLVGFKWLVSSHKLPEELKDRVLGYFEFMWEYEYFDKEPGILAALPTLRGEMMSVLCRAAESGLADDGWFFRHVNDDHMRDIYTTMEPHLLVPHADVKLPHGTLAILNTGMVSRVVADVVVAEIDESADVRSRTFGLASFLDFVEDTSVSFSAGDDFSEVLLLRAADVQAILPPSTWTSLCDEMRACWKDRCDHDAAPSVSRTNDDTDLAIEIDETPLQTIAPSSSVASRFASLVLPSLRTNVVVVPMADDNATTPAKPRPVSPRRKGAPHKKAIMFKPIQHSKSTLEKDTLVKSRFHPKSRFRRALNLLVFLALLYNAFLVPFRLAFFSSVQPRSYLYGFVVDYVIDVLFVVDIAVKYRYQLLRLRHDDPLSFNFHWTIWQQLKWDIVCGFPVELCVVPYLESHADQLVGILTLCRVPKIFRLRYFMVRIKELANTAIRHRPQWTDFIVMCRYLLVILFFSHCLACGWHYLAFADKGIFPWVTSCNALTNDMVDANDGNVTAQASCLFAGTWVEYQIYGHYLPDDGGSMWQRYSRCFNYAIQMLLVVSSGVIIPVNMVETFFCIGAIFAGIFFSAGKIGVIGEIALKVDSVSASIRQATDALSKYTAFHDVPRPLRDKALGFMEYLYRNRRTLLFQEDEIINLLPPQLRDAIVAHCKLERLKQSTVLAGVAPDAAAALAAAMKHRFYAPGDVLVHAQRYGRTMYFVKPGSVQFHDPTIASRHSKQLAVFGARSLLLDEPHPHTICACAFVEAYVLREAALDAVMSVFPALRQQLLDAVADASDANIGHVDDDDDGSRVTLQPSDGRQPSDSTEPEATRGWTTPDSPFRRAWDALLFFTTLFLMVLLPLRATFLIDDRVGSVHELVLWYGGDVVGQLLFGLDTYLSYNWFVFMDHSKLIRVRAKIRENYRPYVLLDVVSILPYWLLVGATGLPALKFLNLPLLLRVKRFPRYLGRFSRNFQLYFIRLSGSMIHILHCILYYVVMVHWWACIWMFLHRYIETDSALTWAVRDPFLGGGQLSVYNPTTRTHTICTDVVDCYVRTSTTILPRLTSRLIDYVCVGAYYFVITFIGTVGLGDIRTGGHLEYFVENIEALCGSFFFAALTSCFTSYFQYADTFGRGAIQAKLSTLASYFRVAHTTKPTTQAIVANTKLWCSRTGGLVESAVASFLPIPLRVELAMHVQQHLLDASSVLGACDRAIRDQLVLALHVQVVCAGATLYEGGATVDEVAFVDDGDVKLVDGGAAAAAVVVGTPGCHVGRGIAGGCRHTVVAVTHVEMYVLDREGKNEVLAHLPHADRTVFLQHLDDTSLHATAGGSATDGRTRRVRRNKSSLLLDEEEHELDEPDDDDDDLPAWLALPQSFFK
ncbi:Aste57867_14989 [Aphanomyces stellatus]|uniref:Aste57867_14989 protein n=1 Tax=Aphanomyces stellatus TaxID=120398 RepID=A0A485L2N4_9STRA|nr:hypothetical protein As57867_014933 [Aphanomyces stellatus]VFT91803.1 Aste57867_14989 [Aphanomyces stellatus]